MTRENNEKPPFPFSIRLSFDERAQIEQAAGNMSLGAYKAFATALEERGFYLAQGDDRPFVAIDYLGKIHSLTRSINVNTKELQARLT